MHSSNLLRSFSLRGQKQKPGVFLALVHDTNARSRNKKSGAIEVLERGTGDSHMTHGRVQQLARENTRFRHFASQEFMLSEIRDSFRGFQEKKQQLLFCRVVFSCLRENHLHLPCIRFAYVKQA